MPLPLPGLILGIVVAIAIGDLTTSPYLDLLARYRDAAASDLDAHGKAVEALAALPNGHSIDDVFEEYQRLARRAAGDDNPARLRGRKLAALANAWEQVLPAAAVMHLETAYFLRQHNDAGRAIAHLSIAREIVDWEPWTRVMRLRPEIAARHASLRRDIYIGIIWTLQTFSMLEALEQHLARARDQFPDDVMVKLALGSLEEVRATAVEMSAAVPPSQMFAMPAVAWRRTSQRSRWDKAAEYYRAALDADSSLAEARMRLGRVLRLRGKLKEARQELEAVVASAPDSAPDSAAVPPPVPAPGPASGPASGATSGPASGPAIVVPYLAEMFLAEVIEEEGGAADALTRYQDIARRWPDCQSGLLALSRAYEARGEREAALQTLRPLVREHAKRACVDPWWTYHLGQGWRFGPFVDALRARVKGRL